MAKKEIVNEITFDIVVSGCATRCWHCYVNGGPGSFIDKRDFEKVIDFVVVFRTYSKREKVEVYPYLDLEPMLHPDVVELLRMFTSATGLKMPNSVPTTGIPLVSRSDREKLLAAYWEAGVRELELTLHGTEDIHDAAVQFPGAFNMHNQALKIAKSSGFKTRLNLMVSKPMLARFSEIVRIVQEGGYDSKRAHIPTYAPNDNLRLFEAKRPEIDDVIPYAESLDSICDCNGQKEEYWNRIDQQTEAFAYQRTISGSDGFDSYQDILAVLPNWRFLSIGPSFDIWYGNGFHRKKKLGSIDTCNPEEIFKLTQAEFPNYAFEGLFMHDTLPSPFAVATKMANPDGKRIYHDQEEIHVKWLDDYRRSIIG